MMRQMRENTKWIMLVTALAFVGLMVFQWGMDLSGRSNAQAAGGHMGSVNGEPITADEYQRAYREIYQQQQEQLGDQAITSAMNRQIEEAAWDQLITNKLLQQELRRQRITVTDDEILQAAQFAPPPELMNNELFQTDGQFDLEKYQQFLRQPLDNQTLFQLEAYYRDVIPRSKLYFQNTAGTFLSDAQLWRMYQDANDRVSVRFLSWDPAVLVPDSAVRVEEAAIRDYYREHREQFERPARATVKFLVMNRVAGAEDSVAAQQRAQEVRTRLGAGETFEAVAASLSADTAAPSQRTTIQVVRNAQVFPPAFEQLAFSAPLGEITPPLLTQFGYHIVRVDSRAGDTATVRQVLVPIELSEAREDALLERADSLESFAEDDELRLDEIGSRMGLPVQTVELAPPLAALPGVANAEEGLDWAYEEGQVGEVSPLFETGNAFYMLELMARTDAGEMTLEEATPAIRSILQRQQQLEQARQQLQPAVAAARAGQTLEQVGAQYGATVQQAGPFGRAEFVPGLGQFSPAIGAAFGTGPGQVSDLVEAAGRLVLVQTVTRAPADRNAWLQQLAQQRERLRSAIADERWQQYMRGLRETADIVDNRAALRRQQLVDQPLPQY